MLDAHAVYRLRLYAEPLITVLLLNAHHPSMLQNTITTLLKVSFWPVATIKAASEAPGASK